MATSEIEKLERRYAENPHGLTFAPLAEVHRKNGDVPRALELLVAGLELHPNYIPASIVLGRCHQDLGDIPSAEAAFAHVLRLDDENVIALKSLADINERLERFGEAETWLRRLVSVDRSNDEAREQLRRIEAAREGSKEDVAALADPQRDTTAAVADEPAAAPALEVLDVSPEPATKAQEHAGPKPEPLPVEIAALQLNREEAEAGRGKDPVAADAGRDHPTPAASEVPAGARDAEAQERDRQPEAAEQPPQPLAGLISAEFQPPLESIGGIGVETSEEVVLQASGETEFSVPDASEDLRSLVARLNKPPEPAPVEPPVGVAPMVEEPVQKAPAELEFIATDTKRVSYVARDTKGQSVADFFHSLLAARLSSEPGGASARHSQDGPPNPVSSQDAQPSPPAVAAGEKNSDAPVSFDDFFGSEGDEATPSRQGSSEPGKDDLDQFQSWLQNLKR